MRKEVEHMFASFGLVLQTNEKIIAEHDRKLYVLIVSYHDLISRFCCSRYERVECVHVLLRMEEYRCSKRLLQYKEKK